MGATGGIFTLITNDGKQDRILMATALLSERLASVAAQRAKTGLADPTPTLLDIEKTHVLFMNAHFKPFAAIGFEYNKTRANAGTPSLGSTVQFSIPQFGDFFHDMTVHVILTQPVVTTSATVLPQDTPSMRWATFPGERLLKHVTFNVNGNPLDDYYFHATNFNRLFQVAPNKLVGWNRCVGQEDDLYGWVDQPNWVNNGVAPPNNPASGSQLGYRQKTVVNNGNQTPTGQKLASLEMFIPLLFWCNTDVRLAVPSVAIPYGQRFIDIELATQAELVGLYPRGDYNWDTVSSVASLSSVSISTLEIYINNIFVNPEVHNIYIKRIGFTLIRVHRQQLYQTQLSSDSVLLQQLKWPIEFMYVGMKIKEYFQSSDAGNVLQALDQWYLFSYATDAAYATQGQNTLQAVSLEPYNNTMPTCSISVNGALTGSNWGANLASGQMFQITGVGTGASYVGKVFQVGVAGTVTAGALAGADVLGAVTGMLPAAIVNAPFVLLNPAPLASTCRQLTQTLDSVTIQAHGINIYNDFPNGFYNAYTSLHYGGPNINTPYDVGALFIPFCLYPNSYQPSGHINISRAREFYLNFTSSVIGNAALAQTYPSDVGVLVVVASAINFLLISDGSAVLRYST